MQDAGASWPFCVHCGAILTVPKEGEELPCGYCKAKFPIESFSNIEVTTRSGARPAPQWVDDLKRKGEEKRRKRAKVEEQCPKCGHPEMEFYTMQLRSADEGQTVFYECLNDKCQHKYSLNN